MKRAPSTLRLLAARGLAARGAGAAAELAHDRVSQPLGAAGCKDIHAMVNPSARALLFKKQDKLLDPWPIENLLLKCYLESWAEANSATILAATAPGYHFHDPFVGLQNGSSRAGTMRRTNAAFFLSGPVDRPAHAGKLQLWREAPRVGLTA
jgi:hypothetical protein